MATHEVNNCDPKESPGSSAYQYLATLIVTLIMTAIFWDGLLILPGRPERRRHAYGISLQLVARTLI